MYQGKSQQNTILAESDEGTMHDLRKIAAGEPRAMEGNTERGPPVSYHIEASTLKAEAYRGGEMVGKDPKCDVEGATELDVWY